jgi:hypothetical protein
VLPPPLSDRGPSESRVFPVASVTAAAVLLTVVFWRPLWVGGGLVGSDIYAYYLPQKAYFAECLRSGRLPLWNNLVGNGYPQVAESQTGVFYPLHWAFYPWLPLNTALSASILTHYALAFVFAAMCARRIGLTLTSAGMAALVYTYGWFPPRICLEWSITGGAWLPLALWCSESFLLYRFWRYALLLTAVLGVQMLAGHFVLAFVTQLAIALYVPLRLWLPTGQWATGELPAETIASRRALLGWSAAAVCSAFFVAAVQLAPTWELKQHSQRRQVTAEHDPGFGYIPPRYLTQIVAPWQWYGDERSFDQALSPGGSRTNRVEAHLYFGMAPLLLVLWGSCCAIRLPDRRLIVWMILGLAAMVYCTGWLLPITKHLPGFSFFEGLGRFGIVTTLAAGLLAGSGLAHFGRSIRAALRWLLAIIAPSKARGIGVGIANYSSILLTVAVFVWSVIDLYDVSRQVTYAVLVADPPANHLAESPLRDFFSRQRQPCRLFSAAKNLPSLLGVATIPVYLGLGPEQYFDPQYTLPQPWPLATPPTREQLGWFHRNGVTHFLSFEPSEEHSWSSRLVWQGADPVLNAALARNLGAKFYLYELEGGRGRVAWLDGDDPARAAAVTEYSANRVIITAESPQGGKLVLTDLAYPGWQVTQDGQPIPWEVVEGLWRGVEISSGKHAFVWIYRPASLYWGGGISLSAGLILLTLAHVRYWHPQVFVHMGRKSSCIPSRGLLDK